jgi:hypothetical protein
VIYGSQWCILAFTIEDGADFTEIQLEEMEKQKRRQYNSACKKRR